MRTTVTLDADVAAKLKQLTRTEHISFKEALNRSVRRGLTEKPPRQAYELRSRSLGPRPGADLKHALRLAGEIEDAETMRKMSQRK